MGGSGAAGRGFLGEGGALRNGRAGKSRPVRLMSVFWANHGQILATKATPGLDTHGGHALTALATKNDKSGEEAARITDPGRNHFRRGPAAP